MSSSGRVLVPVCGDRPDQDAVELGCLVARRRKAVLEAVFVIEVSRSLPLDAEMQVEIDRGERVLDQAEKIADAMEVQFETSLLQARDAGAAIVDEAVQTGAEMIVLGLDFKRKFGDYELGKTATYIMRNAPCRVLLVREPAGP